MPQHTITLHFSAFLMFADNQLNKESHMAKPRVRLEENYPKVCIEEVLYNICFHISVG